MRERLNFVQKTCVSSAGKLLQESGCLYPGARVGLAVSGGVDSAALVKVMLARQAIIPFPIELFCLHVNPGFDPELHRKVAAWSASLGLGGAFVATDYGPRAFGEENRTNSPCFLCSRWRRTRLFELCREYGLTHLAMGHHADDVASTFFMNLFQNGRVDTLPPVESLFQGRLLLIRPLLWLEKAALARAARAWDLPVFPNPCPADTDSARTRMEDWIRQETRGNAERKASLYNALRRFAQRGDRACLPGSRHRRVTDGDSGGEADFQEKVETIREGMNLL